MAKSEMDKLQEYLSERGYDIERITSDGRNQIIVYDENGEREWDAVCHIGSYGYERGLLEVMGDKIVLPEDGDEVCGWLTANDVIRRLEANRRSISNTISELQAVIMSFESEYKAVPVCLYEALDILKEKQEAKNE